MAPRLKVLHRHECGLCDEMLAELEALRATVSLPPVEVIDVDSDPELQRRYGLSVPVLFLDDTLVCKHHLDAEELLRLLRR